MRPAAVAGQKRMEGFGGARLGRSRASCPTRQTNVLLAIARLRRFACEVSAQTKTTLEGGLCLVELGGIEPPTSTLPVSVKTIIHRLIKPLGIYWVTFFKNYPLESDGNRIGFFYI